MQFNYAILLTVSSVWAGPIVVIVRYAEKAPNGGGDPDLSATGHARAESLARILNDVKIARFS